MWLRAATPICRDGSVISDSDRWLFEEGTHERLYDMLGAHPDEDGTRFRVWAPRADHVSVIGNFNGWQPRTDTMGWAGGGVWERHIPGVGPGAHYKFHIGRRGDSTDKADPFALFSEVPPSSASIVWDLSFDWSDDAWLRTRGRRQSADAPVSIYEVHIGSWQGPTRYRDIAEPLADYVEREGYTHVEFLPLTEHPFYGSWGYQPTGYFSPTSRYGVPQDLMYLIDTLHNRDIGVILDWVPSHFPYDAPGLARFDGEPLYEHPDRRLGHHPDWGSAVFDYGRPEVRAFLISSAHFWIEKYHIDALRVDAVASMLYRDYSRDDGAWLPNEHGGNEYYEAIEFLRQLNGSLYGRHPGIQMIAEESTSWPQVSRPTEMGGLGFGYKWDMGWMNDTLRYLARNPIHRRYHHNELTFRAMYAGTENFILPLSHDEVVYGKDSLLAKQPGDEWQRFAGLRLLFGHQWTTPGKKLVFMGGDIASPAEWNHDTGLPWHLLDDPKHAGVARWVADLNRLYRSEPALYRSDDRPVWFRWLDADNADESTVSFVRYADDARPVMVVSNFTPMVWEQRRLGVPEAGVWIELLNSDAETYGGSGVGNLGVVESEPQPWHGYDQSVTVNVPPLATVIFAPEREDAAE